MTLEVSPAAPFWFLRHGETDWNARGLSQGNVDIPLNTVGWAQAERAAKALVEVATGPRAIATIVASPLSRARNTAEAVSAKLGLPLEIDEGLREVSFGVQEGQEMGGWFDDWVEGKLTPEGGESFEQLRQRTVAALNRALARPGPVLVVAHGALWRAFRSVAGLPANVRTPNALPLWVTPPPAGETAWHFEPAELPAL
ncbi:histidine phosphatase family protein [Pseudoroseomonas wenyumeiae]|uniref:Histidine phosphatase family protein n=1 Tax=Teichococcus wenyumeiae TaxID=2478470 RepID=A0A3A9JRB9_9PROT|nr:histidine phosphatase family protein [Pseudoroseomonas wenyumeiae]RKK01489.1 histidine phosphatase family protein [Pseudoroseomonas wenyumeiae]RMI24787.1 histidine phosphatase family protein [Pseudoroseomonas wenyumeiae]